MKTELTQRFYERWPEWFRGRSESLMTNLMPFGFEHDNGWFDLEWKLCEELEKAGAGPEYKLFQIKEKYGTLRWYDEIPNHSENSEALRILVCAAECESAKICEVCGKPAQLCSTGSWVKTLCDACLALPEFAGRFFPLRDGF